MKASSQYLSKNDRRWTRDQLLTLLNKSLSIGENNYARQIAVKWLSSYPGDLQVRLLHARSLLAEDNQSQKQQALQILDDICLHDPEFVEAQKYLLIAQRTLNSQEAEITSNCVLALGGSVKLLSHGQILHPSWAIQLRETRRALSKVGDSGVSKSNTDLEQAQTLIHQVLVANPNTPLAAVTHLWVMQSLDTMPNETIHRMAKVYLDRWPDCIPVMLIYAQTCLEGAHSYQAVSLLHKAVSSDITGQVPNRLWGENHLYRSLWPTKLGIDPGLANSPQNIPIPLRVAADINWEQLPSLSSEDTNQLSRPFEKPYSAGSNQKNELNIAQSRLNQSTPAPNSSPRKIQNINDTNRDGRFPIYVVFSTRRGLEQHYKDSSAALTEAMHTLVTTVRGRRIGHQNWGSLLYLADDPKICAALGIKPATFNDPWSLKLSLYDLDNALAKRGERIGALLIVGGHEVVPFHHLPNPVEDVDQEVPSDNPYGSRDENYFVLEWPVGRLPGGAEANPNNLIKLINTVAHQHQIACRPEPWYRTLRELLISIFDPNQNPLSSNLGYSAAVWQRVSLAVFRSIGDPRSLLISPPVQACDIDSSANISSWQQEDKLDSAVANSSCLLLPPSQFGYFNLHGLSDTSEWYGQRDPIDVTEGPDFPIALRPQDIHNSGHAPRFVFSEACYGAYIHGKKAEEAISIKFLTSGTLAVVGSTSTCYGSVSSPLIAADLLGRVYWGLVAEGTLAGEALRRAKLYLAREMHQRQGYLDGEDQKTLISFVLYGDPLAQPYPITIRKKNIKIAPQLPKQLLILSDQQLEEDKEIMPSPELTAHVKQVVKQYLPGMTDAQIRLNENGVLRKACGQSVTPSPNYTKYHLDPNGRKVFILSKQITQGKNLHHQVARLTMDNSGKVIKLVVSR